LRIANAKQLDFGPVIAVAQFLQRNSLSGRQSWQMGFRLVFRDKTRVRVVGAKWRISPRRSSFVFWLADVDLRPIDVVVLVLDFYQRFLGASQIVRGDKHLDPTWRLGAKVRGVHTRHRGLDAAVLKTTYDYAALHLRANGRHTGQVFVVVSHSFIVAGTGVPSDSWVGVP
jgi:hypothetical protein